MVIKYSFAKKELGRKQSSSRKIRTSLTKAKIKRPIHRCLQRGGPYLISGLG